MTIQMIALNKLRLSAHNVRKSGADTNLDWLVANIAAKGVLQNLIGGAARKKGFYDIFAGGRRLRALGVLADAGKIAKDHLVPVNVLDESDEGIAETSLAENFIRERMTPTDECLAFHHFLGSDGDIDAVAIRFGQTRRFVEGRLRLATLAEPIFDCLAGGDMTMDVAKAYAATADQAKQLAVFEDVKGSWLASNAHEIRKRILGTSLPASHPVALLVGEAAYTAAGGRIVRDLFTEAESAEWLDGDLAMDLGARRMEDAAAAHAEASGIGAVVPLLAKGSTWSDRETLSQARLDRAPLSDAALARIEAIQEEHAQIESECESAEQDDADIEAVNTRIEALEREEAELRNTEVLMDETRKASLTQFVVIGADGQPYVEPALWEAQVRRSAGEGGDTRYVDSKKAAAKEQGLTGVLADELAMARRDVLALHVASDPHLALDLAIFTLADKAMNCRSSEHGSSLMVGSLNDPITRNAAPESAAGTALSELRAGLDHSWADLASVTERFDAFRLLDDEMRARWLAVCVAGSIEASLGGKGMGRHNPFHDHLGQLLAIDVASWWRPTASSYFMRVRKAGMARALGDIGGPVLAAKYASAKTGEIADACEKICDGTALVEPEVRAAGLAWLPAAMRFDGGGMASADDIADTEADDQAGDDQAGDDYIEDEGGDNYGGLLDDDDDHNEDGDAASIDAGEDVSEVATAAEAEVAGEGAAPEEPDHEPAHAQSKPDLFAQYQALKAEAEGMVVLMRMGDFYEAFGDDAVAIADALDVAITKRKIGRTSQPMVGVPVHAAESQIARLIAYGIPVALAEALEDGTYAVIRIAMTDEAGQGADGTDDLGAGLSDGLADPAVEALSAAA